jgi:hypothetical protein
MGYSLNMVRETTTNKGQEKMTNTYTNYKKEIFVKVFVDTNDMLVNYNTKEIIRAATEEECAIWEDDDLTGWQGDFFDIKMISEDTAVYNTTI